MIIGSIYPEDAQGRSVLIAETKTFINSSKGTLSEEDLFQLKGYLAVNPEAGDLIRGTGGIRKLRWGIDGRGKSAGARVIYYYHSHEVPIYLLAVYSKSEKVDLTGEEKGLLRNLVRELVASYHERELAKQGVVKGA